MERIIKALTASSVIYNEPMGQDRIKGYLAALEGLEPDDIVSAINGLVKVCKFFPKPAEIIEAVEAKDGIDFYDSRHPKWDSLSAGGREPDTPEMIENRKRINKEVDSLCRDFSKKMGWE